MTRNESKPFAAVFALRITVADDPRIVMRFETYLFDAVTAELAYRQATEFAPRLDDEYRNSDGAVVTIKCLGIHQLDEVEPDGDDYPGLVSAVEFATPQGMISSEWVPDRNSLLCFHRCRVRSSFPNLDQ